MNVINGVNVSTAALAASGNFNLPSIWPMMLMFVVLIGIAAWVYLKKK